MVPAGHGPVKAARARALAARYPQAAEVLLLVAGAYDLIGDTAPGFDEVEALAERLRESLGDRAPVELREAVPDAARYFQQPDPYDPGGFWARLALEAWARRAPLQMPDPAAQECPRCGHAPQLGVLRVSGNGNSLFLSCSLCRQEWPFRRGACPECLETDPDKLTFFSTEGRDWVETLACRSCQSYLHLLIPERDPAMIPDVDELSLLELDVWAAGEGYRKIWPNLAGL